MKVVNERYYCDRCGSECTGEFDSGKTTSIYVGPYEIVRERLGRSVPHYSGKVYMCLCSDDPKSDPITLCSTCLDSLQVWFKGCE